MSLTSGTRLGPFEILGLIGAGGMGEVYRGRDTRLDRTVALKILTHGADAPADARARLVREARAIAALSHPHICTLHDVGSESGIDFIVEEYLEGETLAERLRRGPLPVSEALTYAVEIADALAAAHRLGLTHGDVKPGNIMVMVSGTKLLDFGLARAFRQPGTGETTVTASLHATIAGTPAYMAPELWTGAPASARSDVWAIGVVIVEMLLGEHPFSDSGVGTITPFAPERPKPLPTGAPASLSRILARALGRDPLERYESAAAMLDDLQACRRELEAASAPSLWRQTLRRLRRPRVAAAVALMGIGLAAGTGAAFSRWSRLRTEVHEARARIPDLVRLVETDRLADAYRLASDLERVIPDDATLAAQWPAISVTGRLDSRPAGALVEVKPYRDTTGPWITLGRTPLEHVRLPAGRLRVRAEKDGYEPVLVGRAGAMLVEATAQAQRPSTPGQAADARESVAPGLDLQPLDPATSRMVFVPPQPHYAPEAFFGFPVVPPIDLPAAWMDKYEVTNREYRTFLTAGGYAHPEYWRHPFVRAGRTLSWQEAVARFVDTTGRPGPASWQLGEYPPGQDDLPVTGVSWFEAAAYAAWAGKALPTVHDWIRAAVTTWASDMLPLSNVAGGDRRPGGPVPVGSLPAISVWGAFDMAGNVKEWCANASSTGQRIVLGGAWDEADYMFWGRDERDPFARPSNVGFRCARYPDGPSSQALSWTPGPQRSYRAVKPVDDRTFEIYRQLYAYDRAPLEARMEETADNEAEGWRREKVSYVSPGGERMPAYVFVPTRAAPPYQALVFVPGSSALLVGARAGSPGPNVVFPVKSGRLVIVPVYKGTYERATRDTMRIVRSATMLAYRDWQVDLAREVSRAVDYLETRPDVDRDRIGYYGLSAGAAIAPIALALEPRFRTAILAFGGLFWYDMRPEADPANFLPRVKVPVLMLNGQYDYFFPPLSRETFYELLGSPADQKRSIEIPGAGHVAPRSSTMAETLSWLDRYLGAVRAR